MNKKGVIAIIVIIVIVAIGYMVWGKSDTSVPATNTTDNNQPVVKTEVPSGVTKDTYAPVTKTSTDSSLITRLKGSSVSASEDGTRVALVNGVAKYTSGNVKGIITLGDIAQAVSAGGSNYALATIAVNSGGAGTYQYVVLFQDKNGTLTDTSYGLIGDRVQIKGVRADAVGGSNGKTDLVVTVTYLDHTADAAMSSAPTVARTKIMVAEDGVFNPSKEINF